MSEMRKNAADAINVPLAAMDRCPKIELIGNREAIVDGCRGVAEYGDNAIRLNISGGSVCFFGKNLEITCLYSNEAIIKGAISNMEFCL